ncbi:MAG: thiosulfate oxidation carrier protein SoxY [Rhodobacteraceae bacterium]|nr:thiosulfate oxidation carrier protein SoxY [Paracoccaceae bacterium]
MKFTRRDTLAMGAGAAVATFMPMQAFADANDEAVMAFTGDADIMDEGVELTAPEIAENGNTVPISVSAPGAVSILILATGNPAPRVIEFSFGPLAGAQSASTRCRLAGTQDIVALAKMADGSIKRATSIVKVTIGGCGG